MRNPWIDLPEVSPFILRDDHESIQQFNAKLPPEMAYRIMTENVIPEPFVGCVETARVIILELNPGYDSTNVASHADPLFHSALLANLKHEFTDWPFYF